MRAGRATERTSWVASSAARSGRRVCADPFGAPGWIASKRGVLVEVLHGSTTGTVAEAYLVSVRQSARRVILHERDDVLPRRQGELRSMGRARQYRLVVLRSTALLSQVRNLGARCVGISWGRGPGSRLDASPSGPLLQSFRGGVPRTGH